MFRRFTYVPLFVGMALALSSCSGLKFDPTNPEDAQAATDTIAIVALVKHYDRDAVTSKQLLKKYPKADPKVNGWLESVLGVKDIVKNPKLDILAQIDNKEADFRELETYIQDNWAKVDPGDKPFVSAMLIKMDALFRRLGQGRQKLSEDERGKLVLDYLTLINQTTTALTGKPL